MATTASLTVEQYLNARFGDIEPEFVRGELIERRMPNTIHGWLQGLLFSRLLAVGFPLVAVRMRLRPDVFRIPDVAFFPAALPEEQVPSRPPLVVIEIVSPDDRYEDLLEKLEDYRAWGVANIWVVEPRFKKLQLYKAGTLEEVGRFELPELNFSLTAAELFAEASAR